MAKAIKGIVGFALIVTTAALVYWPAAFAVAGVLLIFDNVTD